MKSIVYIYRYRSELVSCLPGVVLFVGAVLGPRPLLCLQELSQTWVPTLFARRPLNGPKKSEGQCPQCKRIVPSHAEAGKDQHGFMDCIISNWIDDNWTVQLPQRHSVLHLRSLASLLGMGKEAENNHTVGKLRPCGSPTRQRSLSAFRIFWKVCRWHKLRWGQASCTVLSLELVADGRQNQECRKQHEYRKPMNINENQPVDVSGIFADQPYLCVCFFCPKGRLLLPRWQSVWSRTSAEARCPGVALGARSYDSYGGSEHIKNDGMNKAEHPFFHHFPANVVFTRGNMVLIYHVIHMTHDTSTTCTPCGCEFPGSVSAGSNHHNTTCSCYESNTQCILQHGYIKSTFYSHLYSSHLENRNKCLCAP